MAGNPNNYPTPKRLVLSLLSAPSLPRVGISMLVKWGKLFDIEPASMRVTVGRLARQGLLRSVDRGVYTMGPRGKLMADTARDWVNAEAKVGPWDGHWLLAHTSHLGRVDRGALRARERAFRLCGFAEYVTGLWCRPANFKEDAASTRRRLVSLGLERDAVVMRAVEMPGTPDRSLQRLWPRGALFRAYQRQIKAMRTSKARIEGLALDDAARETLLVGESVIRQINADPLLPDKMVDGDLRREMISGMVDYDELGRGIWRRFIDAGEASD